MLFLFYVKNSNFFRRWNLFPYVYPLMYSLYHSTHYHILPCYVCTMPAYSMEWHPCITLYRYLDTTVNFTKNYLFILKRSISLSVSCNDLFDRSIRLRSRSHCTSLYTLLFIVLFLQNFFSLYKLINSHIYIYEGINTYILLYF